MTRPTESAYAKVNLFLHICDKRANGYHDLDSLMVFVDHGDTLQAVAANDITLILEGPLGGQLQADEDNLVLRAARRLQDQFQVQAGAAITLTKRLPIAAGIGGGSADAAATLRLLCRLWDLAPSQADLDALALSLGADVPICLRSQAAHVSGVGEDIMPVPPLPACWAVLVNPLEPVSTPAVFKVRQGPFSAPAPLADAAYETFESFIQALETRHNDLSAPAQEICPTITSVLEALSQQPSCALARMSGSGATCFGLFPSEGAAQAAQQALEMSHQSWWSVAGKLV